jgi:acyl-CoA thioester hydrolase
MSDARSRDNYVYFKTLSTRWMDNDIYGHVNNVTYYSYFDTIANSYLIEQGGLDIQQSANIGLVVASSCEYHAPIAFPQVIEGAFRVNKLGTKSVQYGLAMFDQEHSAACATGTFTHVFVERESRNSIAIPEPLRSALTRALIEQ